MFAYYSINSHNPPASKNYLTPNMNVHIHNTRQTGNMHKSGPRTNVMKQNLRYRSNTIRNSLFNTIKIHPSPNSFKKNLGSHYLKAIVCVLNYFPIGFTMLCVT